MARSFFFYCFLLFAPISQALGSSYDLGINYGTFNQDYAYENIELSGDNRGFRFYSTLNTQKNIALRIGFTNFIKGSFRSTYESLTENFSFSDFNFPSDSSFAQLEGEINLDGQGISLGPVFRYSSKKGKQSFWFEPSLVYWDIDVNVRSVSNTPFGSFTDGFNFSDQGVSFQLGFGMDYFLTEKFGIGVGGLLYDIDPSFFDENVEVFVKAITMNITYRM